MNVQNRNNVPFSLAHVFSSASGTLHHSLLVQVLELCLITSPDVTDSPPVSHTKPCLSFPSNWDNMLRIHFSFVGRMESPVSESEGPSPLGAIAHRVCGLGGTFHLSRIQFPHL